MKRNIKSKAKEKLPKKQQSTFTEIKDLVEPIVVLEAASTYYKVKLVKTVAVKGAIAAKNTAVAVGKVGLFVGKKIGKVVGRVVRR